MNATRPARFAPNTTVSTRSICDHDCIFTVEILARSASMITFRHHDRVKRCKVQRDHDGNEFAYCLGRYSMAPTFRAEEAEAMDAPEAQEEAVEATPAPVVIQAARVEIVTTQAATVASVFGPSAASLTFTATTLRA